MSCTGPDCRVTCLTLCAVIAVALSGCANTVSISGSVPSPLVEPIPLGVGVHYEQALRGYTHDTEEADDGGIWNIRLGESQIRLFDKLFQALFREAVPVENVQAGALLPGIDLVIKPSIESYSFQTPWGTNSKFYEVDIHYNLAFYTPEGELITHWPIAGHGRSRSQLLSSDKPLEEATIAAMRDAAALVVIELPEKLDVQGLLDSRPAIHAQIPELPDS